MTVNENEKSVPFEAVEAANAALAEERRLPFSSMRAALLAALPFLSLDEGDRSGGLR